MAVIRANPTVLELVPTISEPSRAPRGHLRASFRELMTVLYSWLLDTRAGRAQLGNQVDGRPSPDVLPWIHKRVTGSTVGFPGGGLPPGLGLPGASRGGGLDPCRQSQRFSLVVRIVLFTEQASGMAQRGSCVFVITQCPPRPAKACRA